MKPSMLRVALAALMCTALSVSSPRAADTDGKWALGLHGGLYKLVLTDHSDAWTPGWILGADVKYGLTSNWSLGVEGNWMQTYLAELSADKLANDDGAGSSFDKVPDGPKQRGYTAGLIGQYQFREDASWSVSIGTGMYIWKWTDKDGNTLLSDNAALDNPNAGLSVPDVDPRRQSV
jgi:hypothetical protein